MRVEPIKDQIVLKEIFEEEKRESGLILSEKKKKPLKNQGKIVAINESKGKVELHLGDRVIYNEEKGIRIVVDKEELILIDRGSILGIVR